MTEEARERVSAGAALLALQAEDLHLDQLAYRRDHLTAKGELLALSKRLATLHLDRDSVNAERSVLTDRQDVLENEIAEIDARLVLLDARSTSGEVAGYREQESLAKEMSHLAARKRDLEDEELALMEALEPPDATLASIEAEIEAVVNTRRILERQIATEENEIGGEIAVVNERRAAAATFVPPLLLGEYELLRSHLGGIGVAHVVHGTCAGCNLHLSATEIDRMHRLTGDSLEHCEQCGRLLVP
jgi:predicted  nucleic acid-binding Zn-ribbon protein